MIEVSHLVKRFDDAAAVADVSFRVEPGTACGYLGPNGAGKSTTVKIMAGLLQPTEGSVRIAGFDLRERPLEVKRRLGYVPESAALYATLTPHEHLSLVAELYHLERSHAAERIGQLLKAFEITELADRQIETLSKGQKQKVLLIGSLLHDPEVLLLDEPLNGLDVNSVLTFRQILAELLARGRTILFCSHILEVIERLCSRVIVIDKGKVVADDETSKLLAGSPQGTLAAVFQQLTRGSNADDGVRAFLEGPRPA